MRKLDCYKCRKKVETKKQNERYYINIGSKQNLIFNVKTERCSECNTKIYNPISGRNEKRIKREYKRRTWQEGNTSKRYAKKYIRNIVKLVKENEDIFIPSVKYEMVAYCKPDRVWVKEITDRLFKYDELFRHIKRDVGKIPLNVLLLNNGLRKVYKKKVKEYESKRENNYGK